MMTKDKNLYFFAYSLWDAVPNLLGFVHFSYLLAMLYFFNLLPWWANTLIGLFYAFSISGNVNSVSHNFIHNTYFKSSKLNRAFSLLKSITMGFCQTKYDHVHRHHHIGNNDRVGANGETVDWISIYQHGKNGLPEHLLKYSFLGVFS